MNTSLGRPFESFFLISVFFTPWAQSGYASKSVMTSMTSSGVASISVVPSVCSAIVATPSDRPPARSKATPGSVGDVDRETPPGCLEMTDVDHLGQPDVSSVHQRLVDVAEQRVRRLLRLDVGDQPDRSRFELLPRHVVRVPRDARRHVRTHHVDVADPLELRVVFILVHLARDPDVGAH